MRIKPSQFNINEEVKVKEVKNSIKVKRKQLTEKRVREIVKEEIAKDKQQGHALHLR